MIKKVEMAIAFFSTETADGKDVVKLNMRAFAQRSIFERERGNAKWTRMAAVQRGDFTLNNGVYEALTDLERKCSSEDAFLEGKLVSVILKALHPSLREREGAFWVETELSALKKQLIELKEERRMTISLSSLRFDFLPRMMPEEEATEPPKKKTRLF